MDMPTRAAQLADLRREGCLRTNLTSAPCTSCILAAMTPALLQPEMSSVDEWGNTALHIAADQGDNEKMRRLLSAEHMADPNWVNSGRDAPALRRTSL